MWMPEVCRWKSEILVGSYVLDYHNVSIHFYHEDRSIVFLKKSVTIYKTTGCLPRYRSGVFDTDHTWIMHGHCMRSFTT
jgi:hypothetical protein